jgi:hypothetical protein
LIEPVKENLAVSVPDSQELSQLVPSGGGAGGSGKPVSEQIFPPPEFDTPFINCGPCPVKGISEISGEAFSIPMYPSLAASSLGKKACFPRKAFGKFFF